MIAFATANHHWTQNVVSLIEKGNRGDQKKPVSGGFHVTQSAPLQQGYLNKAIYTKHNLEVKFAIKGETKRDLLKV